MLRVTRLLAAAVAACALGACATYSDSYYYAADDGYGDYYTPRDNRYDDTYYGYDAYFGYGSWPTYYSALWPVYSRYYDPWYSPGFYYGVTYFPRTYFGWGLNYRDSWAYYHAYSPYRWSFYDNYYDWSRYDYYRYDHHGVRDHGDWRHDYRRRDGGYQRYGSARNEAERLAHVYGTDRPYTRGEDWRQRQQGYYADGYRETERADPRYPGDTGGDRGLRDPGYGDTGRYSRDNDNWRGARESGWVGAAPAGRGVYSQPDRRGDMNPGYRPEPIERQPEAGVDYRRIDTGNKPQWRGQARQREEQVYAQPREDVSFERRHESRRDSVREYDAPRRETNDFGGGGWGRGRDSGSGGGSERVESPRYEAPARSETPRFEAPERSEPRDFGGGERDGGRGRSRDEPD